MITMQMDLGRVNAVFDSVDAALRDLTPIWQDARDVLIAFLKQHFDSEGAYAGEGWTPLSPSYAAWKERHYPGKGILRRTDRLYYSLSHAGHADQVFRSEPDFMEWGTLVPYARIHHTGSLKVVGRPPRRTVLPPMTQTEGARIADIFLAHVLRRAQEAVV